jgi:XRE family transcriptional regulator, regulator of sulfur utilization
VITRRDFIVAGIVASATLAVVVWADTPLKPIMHSSVFNWSDLKVQTTKYGARREVFDGRTATVDQLSCHITTLNPGEVPHAAHRHPEEELLVVKEGTLQVMQNGVTNQAGPGAIIFQASKEWHGLRNIGSVPVTYYVFKFVPYGLSTNRTE